MFAPTVYKEIQNKGKKTCKCVDPHCIQRIQTKEIKLVKIGALYTKKFKRKKTL